MMFDSSHEKAAPEGSRGGEAEANSHNAGRYFNNPAEASENPFKAFWNRGFRTLLPIVPPGATPWERSSFAADPKKIGKAPGVRRASGEWMGLDWMRHATSESDLDTWHGWGAGVGLRLGDGIAAFDSDTLVESDARKALDVWSEFVPGPHVFRIGRAPKFAILFRTETDVRTSRWAFEGADGKAGKIELLAGGTQIVAHGVHPDTRRPYSWKPAIPAIADLPEVSKAQVDAVFARLAEVLPKFSKSEGRALSAGRGLVDQSRLRGSLEWVRKAISLLPNDNEHFADRDDYIDVGYAIKAALPDHPAEAQELFQTWASKWEGNENNADGNDWRVVEADWRRVCPGPDGFRIGAPWLYDKAEELSGVDFGLGRAALWFEKIEDDATPAAAPVYDILTEDSVARRCAELFRDQFRYCHDSGAWFEWTGSVWRQNKTGGFFEKVRLLTRELSDTGADKKTRHACGRRAFTNGVELFCRNDTAFAVSMDAWDADHFLLGTPGGTVDLRTGVLRSSRPSEGVTKSTSVSPAATAACPRWLAFLKEATGGDDALIRFLQQWSGYSLTADVREHALVFVYGPGGNGKSILANCLSGILGSYAATAAMDAFTSSKGDKHPTDLAMLRGARLVTASETEEGKAWAESRVKQMTGGDPITARFMRQDFFTFKPHFKLTIVGNHKPLLKNIDDAARRRFNVVQFIRKPAVVDHQLEDKLREEWPAILRWMIDGCLDWQANGLVRPASVVEATEEYFADQDLFGQWIEDECEVDFDNSAKWEAASTLFGSWSSYAKRAGEDPGPQKAFSHNMVRKGIRQHRTKVARGYAGISLKSGAS